MSKLSRVTQLLFASLSGLDQVTEFGTFAQGSTVYSTDPAAIQTATFQAGWFSAVLGNNSPCMEDMNALFLVAFYQLAYLMQAGCAEWDSATTYYIGSFANVSGVMYVSRTNTNMGNNPASDTTNWKKIAGDIMSALGDITYGGANGLITRLAGNTTSTKKYLSQTGTGSVSAAPAWTALPTPTVTRILSASGTYTTPAGIAYIRVKMAGAGGGASGSGTGGFGAGGAGGDTTFGTSLLTATGGSGGSNGGSALSNGGSATVNSPATAIVSLSGGQGQAGPGGAFANTTPSGAQGGTNPFGGAGAGTLQVAGGSGVTNTGAGGGGSTTGSNASTGGNAGGAGAYIEALIASPSATYAYGVGAAGTAGSAGTSGFAGGAGGSGVIIVEEFYQ